MTLEIKSIDLGGLMGYGASCYLVKTDAGFVLIDTGYSKKRGVLEKELDGAGCRPGNLRLIVITHGHGDHTGNAAYLREKYGTRIAMHAGDSEMVERGSIEGLNVFTKILLRVIAFLAGLGEAETFKPDIYLEEGESLSGYGFDAKVLHLPGHSKGSIGILTAGGDLFCGDLFTNRDRPAKHFIVDSPDFSASIERLKSLKINTVYPGHGRPFPMELFIRNSG